MIKNKMFRLSVGLWFCCGIVRLRSPKLYFVRRSFSKDEAKVRGPFRENQAII